ncbi:MAG: hypothetical protein V4722_23930 [Bacteroidota bacterium]
MKKFNPIFSTQTPGLLIVLLCVFSIAGEASPLTVAGKPGFNPKAADVVSFPVRNQLMAIAQNLIGFSILKGYAATDNQGNHYIFSGEPEVTLAPEKPDGQALQPLALNGLLLLRRPCHLLQLCPPATEGNFSYGYTSQIRKRVSVLLHLRPS